MRRLLATIITVLACASAAAAERIERSFNHRFEIEPGTRLELRSGDGEIDITPWDEDAIAVDVTYRVDFRRVGMGKDPDLEVSFDQSGNTVRVIGRENHTGGIGFFSKNELEHLYRIRAPRYVKLDLEGEDGDVRIGDWDGALTLRLEDGDVELKNVRAAVRLELEDGDVEIEGLAGDLALTLSDGAVRLRDGSGERIRIDGEDGNVTLDGCAGDIEITADDGDVEIRGHHAGKMAVRTEDGRVEVEVATAEGVLDLEIETEDGDVELELGEGVSATVDLLSNEGDIDVEPEAEGLSRLGQRVSGRLGDGGGTIRVRSDEGRVSLRHSG